MKNKNMKKTRVKKRFYVITAVILAVCAWQLLRGEKDLMNHQQDMRIRAMASSLPDKLDELYRKNPETGDFVENYSNRSKYKSSKIDLSGEVTPGRMPLLMQWDKRWGYNHMGDEMLALNGCGPTCLSMAYIYLTGDTTMNPRKMARFVEKSGYYQGDGTSWALWTEGVNKLGLTGQELSLDESTIDKHLDKGEVIVCSMRPGDFTTTGHYIVIRGYDLNGYYVNDPNRKSTSKKQWSFSKLQGQIKNLWGIGR